VSPGAQALASAGDRAPQTQARPACRWPWPARLVDLAGYASAPLAPGHPRPDHASLQLREHSHHLPHGDAHRVVSVIGEDLPGVGGEHPAARSPSLREDRLLHCQLGA